MKLFVWDQCFVTGLATVDEQHQRLVDIINQFGELLTDANGPSADDIERVFGQLASYAQYHFHEEEQLMAESGFDQSYLSHHQREHATFLREVTHLHAEMTASDSTDAHALLSFLSNWLAYHILGTDQTMAYVMSAISAEVSHGDALAAHMKEKDPATATLLRAMDGLFHQVSERNRALFTLNRTLEERIAERTRELESMAMTDALTNLPNRRHGLLSLDREWHVAKRHNTPLACMMIDADGFKGINDSYGHDAGDEVLRQLSQLLRNSVRTDDIVCRLGGDEFLVICARTPIEGAMQIAEKLRKSVASIRIAAGVGEWQGSVSVGVATRTAAMSMPSELLKAADQSVYLAKRNGRNCVASSQQHTRANHTARPTDL